MWVADLKQAIPDDTTELDPCRPAWLPASCQWLGDLSRSSWRLMALASPRRVQELLAQEQGEMHSDDATATAQAANEAAEAARVAEAARAQHMQSEVHLELPRLTNLKLTWLLLLVLCRRCKSRFKQGQAGRCNKSMPPG